MSHPGFIKIQHYFRQNFVSFQRVALFGIYYLRSYVLSLLCTVGQSTNPGAASQELTVCLMSGDV
jgi:hypothetical protein